VPVIISLQGILGPYSTYSNWFGSLSPTQVLLSTRLPELLMGLGLLWGYKEIRKAAIREREMCKYTDAFLGRTQWDASLAHMLNPKAKYFHVGEILREEFLQSQWEISKIKRHSILFTNAGHPRRGTEVLLEAIKILKRDIPDIQLRLSGHISPRSGYGRFFRKLIKESGLADCVNLLGYLNASEMAEELTATHVFAIASYIENSPNTLAEAMMVGVPCVASYVGGIPSMIENRQTGLLFPAGDANWLAESIRSVFEDDLLASRLGTEARQVAQQRHCPNLVVSQLVEAYRQVLLNVNMP
ncbi:MAG TPA: glycosyltransferase family 4 protein, partial [Syntrophales bacterium]|nr:glycosyltransferase family 4 protein [Syntrophales bacterium]